VLVCGPVALRLVEVEAYERSDSASHARHGPTARNAAMWGPPGHAYVYLCYGIHQMLNVVTGAQGHGAAVLVRACEPAAGLDAIRARRGHRRGPTLLDGPGKVGAALALDTSWSHHPLFEPGGLELREGSPARRLAVGPRVGIGYATPTDQAVPWRVADADSAWVGHRRSLRPSRD